jgi:hypothetical protein
MHGRNTTAFRETKTQHLLVVSPGNLFGGLRLSPFDDDLLPDRRRGDTTLSAKKNSHEGLSVDKGSPRYNPLLSTSAYISGIIQIYTHDRRKGSTKGVEGKKAGYDYAQGEGSLQIRTRYEDILRKESISRDSS